MSSLGFFSDPHVQYLSQILEEVSQGSLKIPRFQRPLVWEWDQRLELLRSIRRGIPMGAIMVWRTNTNPIECYEGFGRFKFESPQSHSANQYVLDGVQRLTTLYSALFEENSSTPSGDDDEDGRIAYFDLVEEDFVAIRRDQANEDRHLRLSLILNSVSLLRFQRSLSSKPDRLLEVSDEVAKAFREYKIPVIPIVTDDLSLASETFQRINSSGVPMSEVHMLHALTWSNDFNLMDRLESLKQDLGYGEWGQIDEDLLIKIIKAALDCDVYRAREQEVSKRLKSRPEVMIQVARSIGEAADFLWTRMGISTPDMVPYGLQTLILSEAFRVGAPLSEKMQISLLKWIWATTYLEYFTGLSGDKVTDEIQRIRLAAQNDDCTFIDSEKYKLGAIQGKPRFDARTARSRATILTLAEAYGTDRQPRAGFELLKTHGRQIAVPLFSRAEFGPLPELYANPGNRFLVSKEEFKSMRASLLEEGLPDPLLLERHCVSFIANMLFKPSPSEIVLKRSQYLLKREFARFESLRFDV